MHIRLLYLELALQRGSLVWRVTLVATDGIELKRPFVHAVNLAKMPGRRRTHMASRPKTCATA